MNPETVLAVLALPGVGSAKARTILSRSALPSPLTAEDLAQAAGCPIGVAEAALGAAAAQVDAAHDAGVSVIVPPAGPLTELDNPPLVLFARGDVGCLDRPGATLIGTRKPSPGSAHFLHETAMRLAEDGIIVTSGLALGCDAAAHRGCLQGGGATIAVLPCDVADPRPKTHRNLAEDIIDGGGLLISEYGLGSGEPRKHQYLERNRLQAALGQILVVGETSIDGGTVTTMKHAHKLGRPILLHRDSGEVATVHERLAHRFNARLIDAPADVLEARHNRSSPAKQPSLDRWSA